MELGDADASADIEAVVEGRDVVWRRFLEQRSGVLMHAGGVSGPGCDSGVEGVAVGDEDLLVAEGEMAGNVELGVVVAGEEGELDVVGFAELAQLVEVSMGDLSEGWDLDFGDVAVDDQVVHILPQRPELAGVGCAGLTEVGVGEDEHGEIRGHA